MFLTHPAYTQTMTKLTKQQHLFVEAFDGDPQKAALLAGYPGDSHRLKQTGEKLLANPAIIEAIRERSRYETQTKRLIADRQERQQFWTQIMRNEDPHAKPELDNNGVTKPPGNIPLTTRLKASEYLGKSEADFLERIEHTGNLTVTDVISQAYEIPEEDIRYLEEQRTRRLAQTPSTPPALTPPPSAPTTEDIDELV